MNLGEEEEEEGERRISVSEEREDGAGRSRRGGFNGVRGQWRRARSGEKKRKRDKQEVGASQEFVSILAWSGPGTNSSPPSRPRCIWQQLLFTPGYSSTPSFSQWKCYGAAKD